MGKPRGAWALIEFRASQGMGIPGQRSQELFIYRLGDMGLSRCFLSRGKTSREEKAQHCQ